MKEKVNLTEIEEVNRVSPKAKYELFRKHISLALGGKKDEGTWGGGHPFDVEHVRLPPGKFNFPFHRHQVQWELFVVIGGKGLVRRDDREFEIREGDCFIQPPGTAHQIRNANQAEDLVYLVIADHPQAEVVYYPDSEKWLFRPPRTIVEVTDVDYYKGEE